MKYQKSEILQELHDNRVEMEKLCNKQKLTVGDSQRFLHRYFNIIRKFEQLVESRAKWRERAENAESTLKKIKGGN